MLKEKMTVISTLESDFEEATEKTKSKYLIDMRENLREVDIN